MTAYELLDIALAAGNRIDVQWGLFITVHLALFGGIIYVDRPLRLPEKLGAIAIYAAFALLDFRVMRLQFGLLQSAYREIASRAGDACCAGNQLIEYVAADVASGRLGVAEGVIVGGHLIMATLVVLCIVFDQAIGAGRLR